MAVHRNRPWLAGILPRAVAVVLTVATFVLAAAPAHAAISISSFSVTPSTKQAGANPTVTVDAKFASADGDTPHDLSLALASGLLANPKAPTICSAAEFQAQTCPASATIGSGTITGTAPTFGTTLTLPIGIYLIAPQGSEIARIGVIADFFDAPVATLSAPVSLRTTPDVGIDIPLSGIPNQLSGVGIQINEISLTLNGTVNGAAFTRNPTSCSAAATSISVDSYSAPSVPVASSSSFTPTGCSSLAYSPDVSASATADSADDGVAFSATITGAASDAATKAVTIGLPPGLSPRFSALSAACSAADLSTCPSIGAASVTTPLLSAPLQGKLVLVAQSGGLPTLAAVFGAPLAFTLQGTATIGAAGLEASFSGIPDVPISSLEVDFAGGKNSILTAGKGLCTDPQTLTADFTAQSGAAVHRSTTMSATGCSSTSGAGGGGGGNGGGGGGNKKGGHTQVGSPAGSIRLVNETGKALKLSISISAGKNAPGLKAIGVKLPGGLAIDHSKFPRGIGVKLDRKAQTGAARLHGGLNVSLGGKGQGRLAVLTIGAPTLKVGHNLLTRLGKHRSVKLTVVVKVQDAAGKVTTLRLTLKLH